MSTEQEREQLIERAFQDTKHLPAKGNRWDVIGGLVDADWRPQPSGDVIEGADRVVADEIYRIHGPLSTDEESAQQDAEEIVKALADAGYLRTPPDESWAALMALLDKHWPEGIFPTLADDEQRDTGARIVSLLRWVDRLRTPVQNTPQDEAVAAVLADCDALINSPASNRQTRALGQRIQRVVQWSLVGDPVPSIWTDPACYAEDVAGDDPVEQDDATVERAAEAAYLKFHEQAEDVGPVPYEYARWGANTIVTEFWTNVTQVALRAAGEAQHVE